MFIQATAKLSHSIAANRQAGRMRMAAELIEQVATRRQPIEEVVSLDTARRTMAHVAIHRNDHARPVQTLGDFRSCQADHSAMPTVAGDDCSVRLRCTISSCLKLFDGAIEDFALRFLTLVISRVQVLCQAPSLFFVFRIEKLDDGARGIHAAGGIYSWPNAKAKVVGSHFAVIAASSDIHKRA